MQSIFRSSLINMKHLPRMDEFQVSMRQRPDLHLPCPMCDQTPVCMLSVAFLIQNYRHLSGWMYPRMSSLVITSSLNTAMLIILIPLDAIRPRIG